MAAPAASEMALEHAMPAVDERAVGFPCRLRSVEDAEHTSSSACQDCEGANDSMTMFTRENEVLSAACR
jgi:hypothetical protein